MCSLILGAAISRRARSRLSRRLARTADPTGLVRVCDTTTTVRENPGAYRFVVSAEHGCDEDGFREERTRLW